MKYVHYNKEGLVCQPANSLESTMIESSSEHKIKGQKQKSYKRAFKALVFVIPDLIPHLEQHLERLTTSIPASGTMGGRRPHTYPKLETGWRLTFYITINDEQIPALVVKNVLEHAGKMMVKSYSRLFAGVRA